MVARSSRNEFRSSASNLTLLFNANGVYRRNLGLYAMILFKKTELGTYIK